MAPTRTVGGGQGSMALPAKPRVSWAQEGTGLLHSLSVQRFLVPTPEAGASYLTAVREDDHHTAVQGTMVPPC